MRKILNYLGTDGLLHLGVSLILCQIIAIFLPIWAAVIISLAVGVLKELIWDKFLKGTPEWKDILADALGYHFRGKFISFNSNIICYDSSKHTVVRWYFRLFYPNSK